jgi:hypothetical protein
MGKMELHLTISLPNEAGRYMVNPIHSHMRCMFGQISELLWVLDCYSIKTRFIRPMFTLLCSCCSLSLILKMCYADEQHLYNMESLPPLRPSESEPSYEQNPQIIHMHNKV